jgi:hypothetical protein
MGSYLQSPICNYDVHKNNFTFNFAYFLHIVSLLFFKYLALSSEKERDGRNIWHAWKKLHRILVRISRHIWEGNIKKYLKEI